MDGGARRDSVRFLRSRYWLLSRLINCWSIVRRNWKCSLRHGNRLCREHGLCDRARMYHVTHPYVNESAAECNDNARDEGCYNFDQISRLHTFSPLYVKTRDSQITFRPWQLK